MSEKCPTCGGPVKIVGKTTLHYEPDCACGGRIPTAVVRATARKHPEQHTHFAMLPFYFQGKDDKPIPVEVLIFALPAEEEKE